MSRALEGDLCVIIFELIKIILTPKRRCLNVLMAVQVAVSGICTATSCDFLVT